MLSSQQRLFHWLLAPVQLSGQSTNQDKALYLTVYLLGLVLLTSVNTIIWALIGHIDTFTMLAWVVSVGLYGASRYFPYRPVAIAATCASLVIPYILYVISPQNLTLLALVFLLFVTLLTASQFLSFQANLQLAILVLVTLIVLVQVAIPDVSLSLETLLVPLLIIVFLSLLNAYGRGYTRSQLDKQKTVSEPDGYFQQLVDTLPIPALIQIDKRIIVANQAVASLFKTSAHALQNQPLSTYLSTQKAFGDDTRSAVGKYMSLIVTGDDATVRSVMITTKQLEHQDQPATLMLLNPEQSSQLLFNLDFTDTAIPIAEICENIFQQLAASMADYAYAISLGNVSSQIDWVSGAYHATLGLVEEEIKQLENWSPVIFADDKPFYDLRNKALLRGETRTLEYRIVHKDGSIRWMRDTAHPITNETGVVVRMIGSVTDVTETVQAQETLKMHVVQQAIVAELGLLALNTNDQDQVLEHVTVLCEQVLTLGFVAIYNYDPDEQVLTCTHVSNDDMASVTDKTLPVEARLSLPAYVLDSGEAVISDDLADEPRFKPQAGFLENGYNSALGVVILGINNVPSGVLVIYSKAVHDFTHDEVYFVQSLANVLGTFIERNRAQSAARDEAEFTAALQDATAAINANLDLDIVLSKIMTYVQQVVPQTEMASIMLLDDETGHYYHHMTRGFPKDAQEISPTTYYSLSSMPLSEEMSTYQRPLIVTDKLQESRWNQRNIYKDIRTYLGAPVIVGDETIGFLHLYAKKAGAFSQTNADRLKTFAGTAGTAIVNARKKEDLERQVQSRTAELRQQSNRIQMILEGTGDGIFYAEDSKIAFVNDALCQMTGYTADELAGLKGSIFQPDDLQPEEIEKIQSVTPYVLAGNVWRDTIRVKRKQGDTFEAGLTISPIESNDGMIRTVTIVRDKSQEAELESLKKTLIAAAAHDLRSPINSLQIRMHMIKKQPEKLDYHMDRLMYIINRMNSLVNNLLDSHGRIELARQTIILQDLVDQVVDILKLESEQAGIAMHYTAPDEPISILADSRRLEQVFFNLITNAINYTDDGGTITISYSVDADNGRVLVMIQDTGVGIPADEQANIFLPFYRTKDNDRKGNGLGLSITSEIVTLHGGTVTVGSTPGVGSTFTVSLPLFQLDIVEPDETV